MAKSITKWTPERVAEIRKWMKENKANARVASEHFGMSMSALSQGILKKFDKRKKKRSYKFRDPVEVVEPLTFDVPDDDDVPPSATLIGDSNHVALMSLKTFTQFLKDAQWR